MVDEISCLNELVEEIKKEIKQVYYEMSDCRYDRECVDCREKCGKTYIEELIEEQKWIEEKIQTLESTGGESWMERRFENQV